MATPDPSVLHDRARESASEQRKLLTSLSTGSLAVFFLALTTKADPKLTFLQQCAIIIALLLMGAGVLAGIIGWHADAERWFFWAKMYETKDENAKKHFEEVRNRWRKLNWRASGVLRYAFLVGILAGVCYAVMRVFEPPDGWLLPSTAWTWMKQWLPS